jgi:quercetin dioxygenase-like cupin family protein
MLIFSLQQEQEWGVKRHVEKILGKVAGGDVTVACWEPGQTCAFHCHPEATEIYFCFEGGGKMRTAERTVDIVPGGFVVHPAGELHEYINGPQRSMLFRVRYGGPTYSRAVSWLSNPEWKQSPEAAEFFRQHPEKLIAEVS